MIKQSDLLRLIEGECSPEEAAAIQAWVAADPHRGELLDELRAVWRVSGEGTRDWGFEQARERLLDARNRAARGPGPFPVRSRGLSTRGVAGPRAGAARTRRGAHAAAGRARACGDGRVAPACPRRGAARVCDRPRTAGRAVLLRRLPGAPGGRFPPPRAGGLRRSRAGGRARGSSVLRRPARCPAPVPRAYAPWDDGRPRHGVRRARLQ